MGLSWIKQKLFHMGELRKVTLMEDTKEEGNIVVENIKILSKNKGFKGNDRACYVPYNHIYNDKGWGCAWRAIQMVLTAYYKPKDLV